MSIFHHSLLSVFGLTNLHVSGCAFIYIRSAAPNKRTLGATNGLAQTSISIVRAIGPVASTSLFSFSLERNILNGWFVYLVLVIISTVALSASTALPTKLWETDEVEEGN